MPNALPRFSVVVPTYDRPGRLRACLAALRQLDYPPERFEVLVVDDGSPTPLQPVFEAARGPLNATLVRQENAGPAAARNAGAARATGTFLAFTDDDCVPAPGWLRALADGFARAPGHFFGGRTVNALPRNPYATASQQLVSYLHEYFSPESHAPFFASNNIALPTDRFRALGGFSTDFPLAAGEDRELCDRWHDRGWPMAHAPGAVVYHAHPLTLRRFWRQHVNYGRGAFYYHQRRTRRGGERQAAEPLSFYLGLLRYPLAQRPGLAGLPHAALLLLAQVANAAGFFQEKLLSAEGTAAGARAPASSGAASS